MDDCANRIEAVKNGNLTLTEYNFDQLICDTVNSACYLDGVRAQLNPMEWLYMLSSGDNYDWDVEFILDGVLHGFHVVDNDAQIPSYNQKNYGSCYIPAHYEKLSKLIEFEYTCGKLSKVEQSSHCTHAIGVVKKKDTRKIRPITDRKRPLDISVNNFTDKVWEKFNFVTVDMVVQSIIGGKWFMSTVDLANIDKPP